MANNRINHEIQHGKYIAIQGEAIWNWSSVAGKLRWQRRVDLLKAFLGNRGRKVLEVGCGTGLFTQAIAQTQNDIVAIDISPDLLELAKQRTSGPNVSFELQNASATHFADNSFDFIVGVSVLHHLDIELAIREFYRLLTSGGKMMFSEPNWLNPQVALERSTPFMRKWSGSSPDETAFLRWSLQHKLLTTGFCQVEIKPFDFLHPGIPGWLIPVVNPLLLRIEQVPLLKEIAGSLCIQAQKGLT